MNTKKTSLIVSCCIFFVAQTVTAYTPWAPSTSSVLIGSVQFPTHIQSVPNVRIYYSGHKISGETNNNAKQLLFSIPKLSESKKNFLLITEKIHFEVEENTVKYIKLAKNRPYKLYVLTQEQQASDHPSTGQSRMSPIWQAQELQLDPPERRIPDNTIIVCFPPEYVDHLSGGNSIELPHIILKEELIHLAGSEEKLHDHTTQLLLSALDYDTLHAKVDQHVKSDGHNNKTIIAYRSH